MWIWGRKHVKNHMENQWILRLKFRKIGEQKLEKTMFLSTAFFSGCWKGFGRLWGGFWQGFGRGLEALGASWAIFWHSFWGLHSECFPKGLLKTSRLHFGSIWERSGEGLGRILGEFGKSKIIFLLDRVFWFRVLVDIAFGSVWAKNEVP